ncbi:hypothetical protein AVEN_170186-1 [Araneus ventricosus]|uniref:Gustatory receptor n=1 Tax=Araneus ventricosus TaxID=182803 RepID=A0A4Y2MN93_ARAVE|nr:hypothetical protein AVEN_44064-1 [Araneus ventricosus]GBN28611.1 hypothetical protein AVEN_170186-1 [Araneus ventricosus]
MPVMYSISMTLTSDKRVSARFEAYGYETENVLVQVLLIYTKSFLYFLVHPTLGNIVALLYCTLCKRCCTMIQVLTKEILHTSPKTFGTAKQIQILRRKAKIDDVLEHLQKTFSVPTLLIVVGNFLSCATVLGWFLYADSSKYQFDKMNKVNEIIYESLFYGLSSFGCLTGILWVAGGLPVQMQRFKEAFCKKAHLRLICFENLEEPQLKKELFEKPEVVLSGCDIIFFKRSTVLAVFGTLLTYTVLVVNAKD